MKMNFIRYNSLHVDSMAVMICHKVCELLMSILNIYNAILDDFFTRLNKIFYKK